MPAFPSIGSLSPGPGEMLEREATGRQAQSLGRRAYHHRGEKDIWGSVCKRAKVSTIHVLQETEYTPRNPKLEEKREKMMKVKFSAF